MDLHRFDAITLALADGHSRRGTLALLGSLIAVPISALPGHAKKKKKKITVCLDGQTIQASKKKKKKLLKNGASPGACPSSPPPPPGPPPGPIPPPPPTCTDGIKNGDETGVDCGGSCEPCDNGQTCSAHLDCLSLLCVTSVNQPPQCVECSLNADCGSDGGGECQCLYDLRRLDIPAGIAPEICVSLSGLTQIADCSSCPPDRFCAGDPGIGIFCMDPCGTG